LANLDELYGASIEPARKGDHEHLRQATWLLVNQAGADRLRTFIEQAAAGAYICAYLCEGFNTLWLIADDGTIRVAIEEVVLSDVPDIISAPMPKRLRPKSKLGHPSLVDGGGGRIGGELTLNPADGRCYLSNKSGRFGLQRTRTELENAAKLFRDLGIDVTTSYVSMGLS